MKKLFLVVALLLATQACSTAQIDRASNSTLGFLPNSQQLLAYQAIPYEITTMTGCEVAGHFEFGVDVKGRGHRDRNPDLRYRNGVSGKSVHIGPSRDECRALARKYREKRPILTVE